MAAGGTLQGRRVEPGFDNLESAGDYFVRGGILWAILPNDAHSRLPGIGTNDRAGPEWTITEEEDGTVTVDPSIQMHPVEGYTPGWHGYLERGVWREV